jgi:hypothetical protein
MPRRDDQDRRIKAILGDQENTWEEDLKAFFEHLKANLALPCEVTGVEDFRWEEPYILGGWDQQEYERLKETQPSYEDTYELLAVEQGVWSEWTLFGPEDIAAHVRRISDGREFILGLAELKAKPRKSKNYQLIDDYGYWFVNSR